METINTRTYTNTAKHDVLHFVQSLDPTPLEGPHLAKILAKGSLSMRDVKVLMEYTARRASQGPLEPHQCAALGVQTLEGNPALFSQVEGPRL
jgi:hypothetical protein